FGDLDAAEFQASDAVPLADRRIAIAARRRAAPRPRLEHVPDEIASVARILALDGDAEAAAPTRHGARWTGRRQRLDDSFNDFVGGMDGAQRHRPARIGPHDGALLCDHL